jgi:hypothetical protein
MNKALAVSLYLESFPNAVGVVVSALVKRSHSGSTP